MHVDPGLHVGLMPIAPAEKLPTALDDAEVARTKAAVRGALVGRLEALHALTVEELDSGKDRVRWAELQLRVVDRIIKIYKLDEAQSAPDDDDDDESAGTEARRLRELVAVQLDELAGRED